MLKIADSSFAKYAERAFMYWWGNNTRSLIQLNSKSNSLWEKFVIRIFPICDQNFTYSFMRPNIFYMTSIKWFNIAWIDVLLCTGFFNNCMFEKLYAFMTASNAQRSQKKLCCSCCLRGIKFKIWIWLDFYSLEKPFRGTVQTTGCPINNCIFSKAH